MKRVAQVLVVLGLLLGPMSCDRDGTGYEPPPGGSPKIVDHDVQRRQQEARERREAGELLQEGDGYWYVRPKAWRNRTRAYQNLMPYLDSAMAERVDHELYADLMTVTLLPATRYLAEPLEDQQGTFARHLRGLATDVREHKVTMIDRKEAIHHSGTARQGAFAARLDQYVAISRDKLYVIMFKMATEEPQEERERLIQRVLDSWHWDT